MIHLLVNFTFKLHTHMTKTKLFRVLLVCPFFLLMVQFSWAQTKTITGKVIDDKGGPVAGASVLVKGTTTGVNCSFWVTIK